MLRIQKSHAAHIAALSHIFHWHIFPPPFPRAHSSEVKGKGEKGRSFPFLLGVVKESFRGWRAVSSPTHWSWKEERHFLEEKQGGERVVLFPPAAMAGQALASLFVSACPCHEDDEHSEGEKATLQNDWLKPESLRHLCSVLTTQGSHGRAGESCLPVCWICGQMAPLWSPPQPCSSLAHRHISLTWVKQGMELLGKFFTFTQNFASLSAPNVNYQ